MARMKNKRIEADHVSETAPGRWRAVRRVAYRPLLLVSLAAVAAAGFGWSALRQWLPDLSGQPEYRLRADRIHVTQPPRWVPGDLVQRAVAQADLPEELSLLDENLTRDLAEAFAMYPWVEEVLEVRKSFPAAIDVTLSYRRPAAMVQVRQGLYPVDPQGVLLPPKDFSAADARDYPQIAGVLSTPQGPAGSDWGDPIVTQAAALAELLAPIWKKLHLSAIECPRTARHSETLDEGVFTLTTAGGSEIVWGHGPASDHPGELSASQKIERLERYAAKFGGLDPAQGRFRIDIRHWRDIRRVPISADGNPLDAGRR